MTSTTIAAARKSAAALVLVSLLSTIGCSGRPGVLPHPDPALRKSSAEFAAEAAKLHPYKTDAPRGGQAQARAQVGYSLNRIGVANLSEVDWMNIEVWVNERYVVLLPVLPAGKLVELNFQMIFDDEGHYFPLRNNKRENMVNKVEILRDGTMYEVPTKLAD